MNTFERALNLTRKIGNKWDEVLVLWEIGLLYKQSDFNKAVTNMSSLLEYAHRHKLSSLEKYEKVFEEMLIEHDTFLKKIGDLS